MKSSGWVNIFLFSTFCLKPQLKDPNISLNNSHHSLTVLRVFSSPGYTCGFLLIREKSQKRLHVWPIASNVCEMLQKGQFDEYSATLSHRFCCRSIHSLHKQHSGFKITATLNASCCVAYASKNIAHVAAASVTRMIKRTEPFHSTFHRTSLNKV